MAIENADGSNAESTPSIGLVVRPTGFQIFAYLLFLLILLFGVVTSLQSPFPASILVIVFGVALVALVDHAVMKVRVSHGTVHIRRLKGWREFPIESVVVRHKGNWVILLSRSNLAHTKRPLVSVPPGTKGAEDLYARLASLEGGCI
jgi:hypothetical protein